MLFECRRRLLMTTNDNADCSPGQRIDTMAATVSTERTELHLPPELLNSIVGFLDKSDLSTCTILSRRWYPSARRELFRAVFIHDHAKSLYVSGRDPPFIDTRRPNFPLALMDECCECGSASSYNLEAFNTFLQLTTASNIARCINRISIRGGHPVCPMQFTIDAISTLLAELPSLQAVHLIDVVLSPGLAKTTWKPRHLKVLDLKNVHVGQPGRRPPRDERQFQSVLPPGSLIDLLNLFSSVEVLRLTDIKFGSWLNCLQDPLPHVLQFFREQASRIPTSFRITEIAATHAWCGSTQTPLLDILNMSSSLVGLRSLDIYDEASESRIFRVLLKNVGSVLQNLHLTLDQLSTGSHITEEVWFLHSRLSVL